MISVCMATYNGARFIKEQIDSILPQLAPDDELIVSDDGSTDETLQIIESYNDNRIKLLHHERSLELLKIRHSKSFYLVASNFENALQYAKGDYIFLADQDDIWKSNKVATSIERLKNYDIVMSNFSVIDVDGKVTVERFYSVSPISKSLFINIAKSRFLGCCLALKRNVLDYALPFPKKLIGHDYWIGCLGAKKFDFSFITEPLHLYRRTDVNVSPSTEKSKNKFLYKLHFRFVFLIQIIMRLITK